MGLEMSTSKNMSNSTIVTWVGIVIALAGFIGESAHLFGGLLGSDTGHKISLVGVILAAAGKSVLRQLEGQDVSLGEHRDSILNADATGKPESQDQHTEDKG